jgi:hypothetical protein
LPDSWLDVVFDRMGLKSGWQVSQRCQVNTALLAAYGLPQICSP